MNRWEDRISPVKNRAMPPAPTPIRLSEVARQGDLERKLDSYKVYYNRYRCHTGLAGITPAQRGGAPADPFANLDSYRWRKHCNGLFQTPAAA